MTWLATRLARLGTETASRAMARAQAFEAGRRQSRRLGWRSSNLAEHLFERAGVATLAGTASGVHGEGILRLSYANSVENFQVAVRTRDAVREIGPARVGGRGGVGYALAPGGRHGRRRAHDGTKEAHRPDRARQPQG